MIDIDKMTRNELETETDVPGGRRYTLEIIGEIFSRLDSALLENKVLKAKIEAMEKCAKGMSGVTHNLTDHGRNQAITAILMAGAEAEKKAS